MTEKEVSSPQGQTKGNNRARRMRIVALVGVVLLISGVAYWWFFKRNRVSTEDAYVHADSAHISARVPGTVVRVLVENDLPVEVGQTLVELDSTDYEVIVRKNEAILAEDEANVKASEIAIDQIDAQTAAQVRAAEAALRAAREKEQEMRHRLEEFASNKRATAADLAQAARDSDRFENLYQQGAGTQQRREQARTALKKIQAQASAVDSQIAALQASLSVVKQEIDRASAQLDLAQSSRREVEVRRYQLESLRAKRDKSKADLQAAKLNLTYCSITAPIAGYIAQKRIQVGDRVQPGQGLMAIVPLEEIYIEANFKETQLTNVRLGQPATIRADIYPNHTFRGRVIGIRAGTGAVFSLLPPENATGNWIKVVQRVPVKIHLEEPPPPDRPLRVGLSLEVTVDTSDRSGKMLVRSGP